MNMMRKVLGYWLKISLEAFVVFLFALAAFADAPVPWEEVPPDTPVNTNIISAATLADGAARPLPKYLHALDFADSYPDAAAEYYRSRGDGKVDGGCSAVRDGGFLYRNFDFPFDDRAEFVVKMSAGAGRFASVGVAQVGTNLTEAIVTSGKPSRYYKCLPGATVDGINENGVVVEINVVDGPVTNGWQTGGDLHPLAAVRWVLDNATNAQSAAEYLAANIRFPDGWTQNFHYMIADERETRIVEDGRVLNVGPGAFFPVLTNFRIGSGDFYGPGFERRELLSYNGTDITNTWYTRAYRRETNPPWVSDLAEVIAYTNDIFDAWAAHDKEYFRGKTNNGIPWWQSVHTSVYDITNRVLRVAVQETDDWYTFAVSSGGGTDEAKVREIASEVVAPVASSVSRLQSSKADKAENPTENNFAALTAEGGIKDSGKKASDFAPAVEGGYLPLSGGTVGGIFVGDMGYTTWLGFAGLGTLFFDGTPGGDDSFRIARGADGLVYLKRGQPSYDPGRELAVKGDLAAKLDRSEHERHPDSVTNVVWETCYSNGWVFLRAAGPKEED